MEYVEHRWINPGTIEKRSYQSDVVKTALAGNTLCVLPTGLGKTSIAALVVADRLDKYMDAKVLFMAPTRPLVNQHKTSFERFFKTGLEMRTVTGEDKPETRKKLYSEADIIFSTPQTIRNDLENGTLHLSEFYLCIFDEAHRCVGNYAYSFIAKIYSHQSKRPLILALTASPGSQKLKIDEIKKKMSIESIEIRTREDEDVKKYVQETKHAWIEVELSQPMKSIHAYLETIKNARIKRLMDMKIINNPRVSKSQLILLQQKLSRQKSGYGFMAMSLIAEIIKVDHAMLLLETQTLYSLKQYLNEMKMDQTKAAIRLMKEENFINAVRMTNEIADEGQEHPKLQKLTELVKQELQIKKDSRMIIFAQYRSTIEKIYRTMREIKNAAPVEFIGQAKKHGKGLSQKEQTEILNEFRMGFYNILCASQVAEEGLDVVETDLVIFYEPVPSAIRKIQRAGRTARTRVGSVFVLLTKQTRDEAYHWSAVHKENKMKKILYDMQAGQKNNTLDDFNEKS